MIKTNPHIGFNDLIFLIPGLAFVSFFIPQIFFQIYPWQDWTMYLVEWGYAAIYTLTYWMLFRWMMIVLRKRFPKHKQVKKRLGILFLGFMIVAPLVCFVITFIIQAFNFEGGPHSLYQSLLATYLISFAFIAVYEAIYFYIQLQKSLIEKETVKREHIKAELQGLRNQVNPHFLFNSLNTVLNLINESPVIASDFLRRLSQVYRYILESKDTPTISLSEELTFIKAYVFLQEERFKGNLKVLLNIPESFHEYQIIPLSLQILFENAIKHNIISSDQPLLIEVGMKGENSLEIKNNLQKKKQVLHSTKVGLENIRSRYQYFTDRTIDIQENGTHFIVTIPLITPILKPDHAYSYH